jgi:molybdate transport system substrate-binding protein
VSARIFPLILIAASFGLPAAQAQDAALSVSLYAAASTKDAVAEIAKNFEKETGIKVEVIPGPSSGLARQIEQGAAADLFLSADQASADYLAEKKLVAGRKNLLTNKLVVILPSDSAAEIKSLADLTKLKRIALAEPRVPAGEYARQALTKEKLLDSLKDKIIGGVDVRATLQYVVRGEVDAGVVYHTDAVGQTKIKVALEIPAGLHSPIEYPLVQVAREKKNSAAVKLYEYLMSEKAAEVFRKAQFGIAK